MSLCDRFAVEDRGFITPCWIWLGRLDTCGYGCIDVRPTEATRSKTRHSKWVAQGAHKFMFTRLRGSVVGDLELDHLCRIRSCVNPWHLEPVTHEVNVRRGNAGSNSREKTHCPNGHEYSPENTTLCQGRRFCRTCNRDRTRAYRARKAQR